MQGGAPPSPSFYMGLLGFLEMAALYYTWVRIVISPMVGVYIPIRRICVITGGMTINPDRELIDPQTKRSVRPRSNKNTLNRIYIALSDNSTIESQVNKI